MGLGVLEKKSLESRLPEEMIRWLRRRQLWTGHMSSQGSHASPPWTVAPMAVSPTLPPASHLCPETPPRRPGALKVPSPRGLQDGGPACRSALSSLRLRAGEPHEQRPRQAVNFLPDSAASTQQGLVACYPHGAHREVAGPLGRERPQQTAGRTELFARLLGVVRSQPKMLGCFDLPFPLSVTGKQRKAHGPLSSLWVA